MGKGHAQGGAAHGQKAPGALGCQALLHPAGPAQEEVQGELGYPHRDGDAGIDEKQPHAKHLLWLDYTAGKREVNEKTIFSKRFL